MINDKLGSGYVTKPREGKGRVWNPHTTAKDFNIGNYRSGNLIYLNDEPLGHTLTMHTHPQTSTPLYSFLRLCSQGVSMAIDHNPPGNMHPAT